MQPTGTSGPRGGGESPALEYMRAALVVVLWTLIGLVVFPFLSRTDVAMVYLLGVAWVAARHGRGPSIFVSCLSIALFDFFFVPPRFTLGIADAHYVLTFGVMLAIALFTANLTRRSYATAERAEASERRFRQLTENIPEVFYVSTADLSKILYTSPAYEHVWGQPLERLYENPRSFLEPVHPEDLGRFTAAIERVQRGEIAEVEFRLALRDGTVRSIMNRIVPVRDAAGRVYRIVGVARDVTEQCAAREAEHRAREEADRATAAKMAFLANMSHEIRTPMSGVLGMAELLRGTSLTPEQNRSVEVIVTSAEALLVIINDILDLSKIEAGELTLESIPFNLPALVHSTVRLFAVKAFERGVELVIDCGDDVPQQVRGDPSRLRQVLTNLLGNAVKFTSQGEVELLVHVAQREGNQATVEFAVRDTGIGIAPDQVDRIFAPFGQADISTTRKYGGTGLGLSISRRLVRLMGSDISLESEVGQGSTFWFRVAFPVEELADAVASRRSAGLRQVRTLVVDDNATNRHVLAALLRHAGADADEVASVDDAMDALYRAGREGHPYRLLISDVNMPGRDGFGLARDVRGDLTLGDIRLMLLTSAARPGDADRCRQLGVAAYLQKPVSQAELVESAIATMSGVVSPGEGLPLVTRHTIEEARRSLHILLAEDNVVNQEVTAGILRKRGHRVDIVENGRRAVEAARDGSYDVILMDIQMPVLDGLAATGEIRALPAERHVPIIALTADAVPAERARCLAGGMDRYLTKPFKAFELFAAVEGWTSPSDVAPEAAVAGAGNGTPAVDIVGFRAELRAAGIEEALTRILAQYHTDAPARLTAVEEAVRLRDPESIRRAAHAFKSSAGTIRAAALAASLRDMESAARSGDVNAAVARIDAVRKEHAAVEACLAAETAVTS